MRKRHPGYSYRVCIWLGDQCPWCIMGTVYAFTEEAAIAHARDEISTAWPFLREIAQFGPASALATG